MIITHQICTDTFKKHFSTYSAGDCAIADVCVIITFLPLLDVTKTLLVMRLIDAIEAEEDEFLDDLGNCITEITTRSQK